jgi:tellurite resistance protein TerC
MGALILRGLMIGVGAAAVERFQWILYIFGAFLIFTAIKMVLAKEDEEPNPEEMFVYKAVTRFIRVTPQLDGEKFITRVPQTEGSSTLVKAATPLFLVLVLVEFTDVIFAVDSIPAIFGITRDPFIVFTSNVFAILGLRSLYFALAGAMGLFKYLKPALAFVLAFIGVTMLLHMWHIDLPTWVKLTTIASALTIGVGASLLHANKQRKLAK